MEIFVQHLIYDGMHIVTKYFNFKRSGLILMLKKFGNSVLDKSTV